MAQGGEFIKIPPSSFQVGSHKCIVYEEGTGKMYEHSPTDFHKLLEELTKNPNYDKSQSDYYKTWLYKIHEVLPRLSHLSELYESIKENGVVEPVHCEITGERLDGSYRTKIAMFLGIKEVPAILHRFKWHEIDEDFIERKLKVRWESSGKDYYEFEYGYKGWKNIPKGGEVYRENAEDRWNVIKDLVKGRSVLDIGCNEGYMALQLARQGKEVTGIDIDFTHLAYLNKLIYEFIDKKSLDVEFYDEDATKTKRTAETVLFLNVLYHFSREEQVKLLEKFKGKQMIFQCNLRKSHEREKYYTSHPDDLTDLLNSMKIKHKKVEWRDKPFLITT